jgi:hypothetical protein
MSSEKNANNRRVALLFYQAQANIQTYSIQYYTVSITQLCSYLQAACFGLDIEYHQAKKNI